MAKMKKKQYWEKRSEDRLLSLLSDADKIVSSLSKEYVKASKSINKDIESLYARFMSQTGLDKDKAMELIQGQEYFEWRMSMQEYMRKITLTGDKALELELNTLAMRSRITRLEALQAEITAHATLLAQETDKSATELLTESLKSAYAENMYDEYKDRNPKVLELMENHSVGLSGEQIEKVLTTPWSGKNYSENIWDNTTLLAQKTKSLVAQNIISGKSIQTLTREITSLYGKQARYNAYRLLRTETAYVKGQADLLTYDKLEVEEYELLSTLDNRTSEICRRKDGEHYPISEARVGVNYPPFHPFCRTTTIKYNREYRIGRTRIAKNAEGRNISVPLDMKYNEWREMYAK